MKEGQKIKMMKMDDIEGANIGDLAPTILFIMDEDVPTDIDGKVLKDIFEDQAIADKEVRYDKTSVEHHDSDKKIYTRDETVEIEQRMKDLGYM